MHSIVTRGRLTALSKWRDFLVGITSYAGCLLWKNSRLVPKGASAMAPGLSTRHAPPRYWFLPVLLLTLVSLLAGCGTASTGVAPPLSYTFYLYKGSHCTPAIESYHSQNKHQ